MTTPPHHAPPSAMFPPQVLGSYAFIADGERGCLLGPRGDVAWMCAPSWDSDAVFASLIGGPGVYAVTPTAPFTWAGYYEPGSLIWRSRWITHAVIVEHGMLHHVQHPHHHHHRLHPRSSSSPDAEHAVSLERAGRRCATRNRWSPPLGYPPARSALPSRSTRRYAHRRAGLRGSRPWRSWMGTVCLG